MTHPISLRFRSAADSEGLKTAAAASGRSTSSLAEELISEGLRMRRHPLIGFRDGPSGRRASLVNGPDIWEVVEGLVGGDVATAERIPRAVELFALRPEQVEAALAYYAEFTDEINDRIEANRVAAAEAEANWRHGRNLLAR